MIRRIIQVALRDVKNSFRDPMVLYIMFSPMLLAVLLLAVTPEQDSLSVSFALGESVPSSTVAVFETYGDVEVVADDALETRVRGTDEIIGVGFDTDYFIVVEGNETAGLADLPNVILAGMTTPITETIEVNFATIGRGQSLLRSEGAKFIFLFIFIIPGVMVGLSIVDEKESNTIAGLMVTPLRKAELFLGKSVFGIVISIGQLVAVLIVLGYTYMDPLMIVAMFIPAILSGMLLGFIIGAVAADQIAALGLIKFGFLPMMVSFLGTLFIPEGFWWTLYWSPYFFLYRILSDMMLDIATWNSIGIDIVITLAISAMYIVVGGKTALKAFS
jgi:ABC-2 type transport system permease protein